MFSLFNFQVRDHFYGFWDFLENMNPGGYTVEVSGLSPKATEKDVYDFFAFSGAIEHVEIAG